MALTTGAEHFSKTSGGAVVMLAANYNLRESHERTHQHGGR
jgi:hypothetical protein